MADESQSAATVSPAVTAVPLFVTLFWFAT
jgi:hypothetical protein